MRRRIEEALAQVESEEDVRILYAVESGSRAWGFASRDSDWDVRFLYVHPRDWYLSIEPDRDVIERPIEEDLDVAGWDLRKALVLFRKGNPPLLEWLRSPIVYLDRDGFAERLRAEVSVHFRPVNAVHHYLSMARKNYREYLRRDEVRLKKYFYVLRPLLAADWVRRHGNAPPMEFAALVDDRGLDAAVRADVDALLDRKRRGDELDVGPRIARINEFIEELVAELEKHVAGVPKQAPPPRARLDALFRSFLQP